MLFRGNAPALVTPFSDDNSIDEGAFKQLINDQIAGGVSALVVLGTTGENPTISHDERRKIVGLALECTEGRVPVIIGTGTNDTHESVVFSREAASEGASGLLVVGPYYNKPTQDGLIAHVSEIAAATDCPIIYYNVPGRTASNILPETMLEMVYKVPTVVGIKEASGNLAQITDILAHRPKEFAVYSGDDEFALPILLLGGDGVISVLSNARPAAMSALIYAGLEGRFDEARSRHFELVNAMRACFYESNPVPIKTVLAREGKMQANVRLPLVPLGRDNIEAVPERVLRYLIVVKC